MQRIVIVGAGAAGLATADALRTQGHGDEITLLGAEEHPPYDRPPLSKQVLAGEWSPERVALRSAADLAAAGICFRAPVQASGVDTANRAVALSDGSSVGYDSLVVATGVVPRRLPFGHDLAGVHVLRGLDDAVALQEGLADASRVVVIGAGFLGSEVAAVCRQRGAEVALVDTTQQPLQAALGTDLGGMIAELHRDHEVDLRLGRGMASFGSTAGRVSAVVLDDGTELPTDLVVVAIGSTPAVDWLRSSTVPLAGPIAEDRAGGIRCDEAGRSADGVWAVGDVAAWWSPSRQRYLRVEHRLTANQHAQAVARDVLGLPRLDAVTVPYFWSDQYDLKLQSYGMPTVRDQVHVVDGSLRDRRFVAVYTHAGRVSAVVGAGKVKAVRQWRQAVAEQRLLSDALQAPLPGPVEPDRRVAVD